jgi:hypothetical protein
MAPEMGPFFFAAKSPMLNERAILQFVEGLLKFLLRVHHDGTVPRDRLFNRFSRNQQKPNPLGPGLHNNFIAAVEQHQGMIGRVVFWRGTRINR